MKKKLFFVFFIISFLFRKMSSNKTKCFSNAIDGKRIYDLNPGYIVNISAPNDRYVSDTIHDLNSGSILNVSSSKGSNDIEGDMYHDLDPGFIVDFSASNNVTKDLISAQAIDELMGIELPKDSTFTESQFELIQNQASQSNTRNFLYYLFDVSDDAAYSTKCFSNGRNEPDSVAYFSTNEVLPNATESFSEDLDPGSIINMSASNGCNAIDSDIFHLGSIGGFNASENAAYSTKCFSNGRNEPDSVAYFSTNEVLPNATESFSEDLDPGSIINMSASNGCNAIDSDIFHLGSIGGFNASENAYATLDYNSNSFHAESEKDVGNSETFTFGSAENKSFAIKPHHGCDNSNMFVPTSDQKTKKYCCTYCLKRYPKLERHLGAVHKDEADVKKYQAFPLRSRERRAILDRIRKRGQFEWNTNAKINGGELSTCRRPNRKFNKRAIEFLTCANCKGAFATTALSRHWDKCAKLFMVGERLAKTLGRAVEGRLHSEASDDLRTEIFPKMREDDSVRMIRFDWLVIAYGNDLCLNYSPHYQHGYIRSKLKSAGKVLRAARSISSEISDLSSLFHVKHCNTVVEAIRIVAKFNLQSKIFGSPGTASTLVTLINTIGELLVIESMKLDDEKTEKNVERFLKVFQKDVKTKINKLVAVQQSKARRYKKQNIPTTEDVQKLASFLDSERDQCFTQLSEQYSYKIWLKLSEITLASILLFNRRRTGEMRNILLTEYLDREIITAQCDTLLDAIPEEIKRLIKSRMKIRGKLNRTVPVLLKYCFDDCLELLIRHRKDALIPAGNEFLFALPTLSATVKTIDACAVMRSFSIACGAKNPSSLRGTNLRKHLASFCAAKGTLNDNDVTNVAGFMGHDVKIHGDVYRHNPLYREVAQMTALLGAAQGDECNDSSYSDSNFGSDSGEDEPDEVTQRTSVKRKTIRRTKKYKIQKLSSSKPRVNEKKVVTTKKNAVPKQKCKKRENKKRDNSMKVVAEKKKLVSK